ncbi:RidA family protein [Pseudonocardia sp. CA-107938]|uniref:RidA family protein n=1 Tax=Pseudonocardia sp. CA-107938 TaxID=3240021 RepID=UPI003D94C13E
MPVPHLPADAAVVNDSAVREQISTDPDWYEPHAISQAIRVGDVVHVSGQAGIDEHGATVATDFDGQARQAFANLDRVLRAAGSGLEHVVKVTILVTDMSVIDQVIALSREFFTEPYPADTIAQVVALARPDWLIEIEAVGLVARG